MGNTNSNSTKSRSNGNGFHTNHVDIHPVEFQATISNTATTTGSVNNNAHTIYKTHQNQRYSNADTHTRSSTIKENEIYGHTMNDTVVVNQYTEDITAVSSPFKMTMITEDFNSDNDQLSSADTMNIKTSPLSKGITDMTDIYSNGTYEEAIDHANTIDLSGLDSCSPSCSPPAPSQHPSSQPYGSNQQLTSMRTMLDLSGDATVGRSRKVETPLDIGEKVWILSNNTHLWRECVIREHKEKTVNRASKLEDATDLEIKKLTIRVHYISFSSYYDEWLDHDSTRIALQRPDGDKLHIGDNFSLYSEQYHAWLEAEVCAIDRDNHTVQVMLVSPGNPMGKEWFSIQSPLISIKHKQWDAIAPIVWNKSVKL